MNRKVGLRRVIAIALAVVVTLILASCAPVANGVDHAFSWQVLNDIWSGFWHGAVALLIAIYVILDDLFKFPGSVEVFDVNAGILNHVFWVIGFLITSGGLGIVLFRRRR